MHDLKRETLRAVDQYWASFLSCPADTLQPRRGIAVPHTALGSYPGIYAVAIGDGFPIASVPASLLDTAKCSAPTWTPKSIREPKDFATMLGDRAGQVLGPARVSYCDASSFRPTNVSHNVRTLSAVAAADVIAVEELRRVCPSPEWESGGSTLHERDGMGVFIDGVLVALAGYEQWGERLAHISVVTHPDYRGRSFGQFAVSALAARLLSDALIPQYRTLEANTASLRIGTKLGFVPYATSLVIRFREADT